MMRAWMALWAFLVVQKVVVGLAITSAIKVMPPPDTPITWRSFYAFLYDWFHQFFNINNTRLTPQALITPPGNSEVTK